MPVLIRGLKDDRKDLNRVKTIIGIPGHWKDRYELLESLVKQKILFAGNVLRDLETETTIQAEVYPYDSDLAMAFFYVSNGTISEKELNQIHEHTHTLYLIFESVDTKELLNVLRLGSKILHAGGLAVKVETSGIAHSKEKWLALTEEPGEIALYRALVSKIEGNQCYYSCGMHQFGLRDAMVQDNLLGQESANQLLDGFLLYLLIEKPSIQAGHTFSLDPQSPVYRIDETACTFYPPDDLFFNPRGYWTLSRLDQI